jgi:hypothetical protein
MTKFAIFTKEYLQTSPEAWKLHFQPSCQLKILENSVSVVIVLQVPTLTPLYVLGPGTRFILYTATLLQNFFSF